MAAAADPRYDLAGALTTLVPGLVLQRQLLDAAAAQYAANGFTPILASQVPAILAAANGLDQAGAKYAPTAVGSYPAALPAYPTGMKRFADSNPASFDDWSIETERDLPTTV